MKSLFPKSFYNTITLVGTAIVAVTVGLIGFLFLVDLFASETSPYLGVITFVILPLFLIPGIGLIIAGIVREHRRERTGKPTEMVLPRVDLNLPRHRNAFLLVTVGSFLLLATIAFVSYQGYEYTESVEFCGRVCHSVMKPEYTAYKSSPHARVKCVECHIGPGSTWFVRSKLSGLYQVYATAFNKYPRPIPTPIRNLRPARETCEQCHWPRHFAGEKLRTFNYYLSDKDNTPYRLELLVKIGGGASDEGPSYGIHWHMNIANQITYAALDEQREIIPWVKVKSRDGKVRVFRSTEIEATDKQIAKAEKRLMDCIDCHNRPTHIYHHPSRSVNLAMAQNKISPELPEVKRLAVESLEGSYKSQREAMDAIGKTVEVFYRTEYPQVYSGKKAKIEKAVRSVQQIYNRNYFPVMNVRWDAYPDNIGHMQYLGCFRCHDGKHVSDDGKTLSKDCNMCHEVLAQKLGDGKLEESINGVEFRHPVDIGGIWKDTNCSDCHGSSQ